MQKEHKHWTWSPTKVWSWSRCRDKVESHPCHIWDSSLIPNSQKVVEDIYKFMLKYFCNIFKTKPDSRVTERWNSLRHYCILQKFIKLASSFNLYERETLIENNRTEVSVTFELTWPKSTWAFSHHMGSVVC